MLKIWGHLFQYIKSEHIEDTYLLMDSFISKYDQLSDVLMACGIQSERATYEFDHYNHKHLQKILLIILKIQRSK